MREGLHEGDCLEVLRKMADASVDAIVTDRKRRGNMRNGAEEAQVNKARGDGAGDVVASEPCTATPLRSARPRRKTWR
jgi:hypothetical protein